MKAFTAFATAAALCVSLSACIIQTDSDDNTVQINSLGHLQLGDGRITLHNGKSKAVIDAKGELSIDGKAVALTPQQRVQTQLLYANAIGIRDDGLAMGKAGAAIAGKAVGAAVQGVLSGDHDGNDIEKKVEAETAKLEEQAQKMCNRLTEMRRAQDSLVATLPAFQPFAQFKQDAEEDCKA
ncbi:DUF2884 family protein [Lysobacter silvisoli]|uniref:DUF2884 family protein n=1 Tax=Lysobacter silvisoli TaxID=2293254 RepID=A0A371K388_9GAMM|nr:DUF2884 family protein [Lysobacter silvisoli]RDZ28395.1 DUF2884 family protein [Lysobacter silvisoli]